MYDMVRLSREHALYVALDIAQNKTIALGGGTWRLAIEGFDLKTLQNRNRKVSSGSVGVVEDGAAKTRRQSPASAGTLGMGKSLTLVRLA